MFGSLGVTFKEKLCFEYWKFVGDKSGNELIQWLILLEN